MHYYSKRIDKINYLPTGKNYKKKIKHEYLYPNQQKIRNIHINFNDY